MNANERIKIKRKIKNTNNAMIKLLPIDNTLSDFTNWLEINKDLIKTLTDMTTQEFLNEALKTNVNYIHYELVKPVTKFMIAKAEIYQLFLNLIKTN